MAEQPGQEAKDTGQETIFNSGIGDDWGEAFEAEDFMAAPKEETSTEFFLPDEPTAATINIPGTAVLGVSPAEESPPAGHLTGLSHSLLSRFRAIPLPFRLAAVAVPILAVSLFLILRKAPAPVAPGPEVVPKTAAVHPPAAETPAVHPPEPETEKAIEEAHSGSGDKVAHPLPPEPALLRKKWRFPAIIVHSKTDAGQESTILTADLTLILKLAPETMPPSAQDSFIREILYQFYTNQPPDDLQRYALERGEMNRKLLAWIMKQWPELPLDAIAIDRYQLL